MNLEEIEKLYKVSAQEVASTPMDCIEETVMRLHVALRNWEEKHNRFGKTEKKLQKVGISVFTEKDKEELRVYAKEYRYYLGKMMAYLWILEQLGPKELSKIIGRVRGMNFSEDGAYMFETKFYRSKYGLKK